MRGSVFVLFVVCWMTVDVNGQCGGQADIVIAIPGGHDVPEDQFAALEDHIIDLLYSFKLTSSDINIGLIMYGAKAVPYAYPQPFKNRLKTNTRVSMMAQRKLKYTDKTAITETKVSVALRMINNMLTGPPPGYRNMILRPNTRKIGITYTWGKANTTLEREQTINEAEELRKNNIIMYGLSANGRGEEFERIVTDKCRRSLVVNLNHGLQYERNLGERVCSELDPQFTVLAGNCINFKPYGKASPIVSNCGGPDNRNFADPNNCAYQLVCEYPIADLEPQRQRCAEGTLYSSTTKTCVHMDNSICFVDIENCPIDAGKDQELFPHPADCGKYISCGKDRVPSVLKCPGNLYFDVNYGLCNHTQFVDCIKIGQVG